VRPFFATVEPEVSMTLSKVFISVVLSLLFLSLFSGICQAGELDEKEIFKRLRITEEQDNPWKMVSEAELLRYFLDPPVSHNLLDNSGIFIITCAETLFHERYSR
jgi:hypothetical protein